ncbi:hypothetical protein RI367_003932 [Sorochytrium milnesiophthora]
MAAEATATVSAPGDSSRNAQPTAGAVSATPASDSSSADPPRLTWNDCNEIIVSQRLDRLNRTLPELARYKEWMATIERRYASVADFIHHQVFSRAVCPRSTDGRLVADVVGSRAASSGNTVVFRKNDFPNHFALDIEHWVLWSDPDELPHDQVQTYVSQWIHKQSEQGGEAVYDNEWLMWVNPPARKTIAAVWHAHILLRRRQQQ